MHRFGLGIMILVCFSLLACMGNQPRKEVELFHEQIKLYGKLIRWQGYQEAYGYVEVRDGQAAVPDWDLLKEIRVTSYKIGKIVLNEEQNEAQVEAQIDYYHERVNSVHEIIDRQTWWYNEELGLWRLDGSLPPFKK